MFLGQFEVLYRGEYFFRAVRNSLEESSSLVQREVL
jgi:hypothetical protein